MKLLIAKAHSNAWREPFVVDELYTLLCEHPDAIDERSIPTLLLMFQAELDRVSQYSMAPTFVVDKQKYVADYEKFIHFTKLCIQELHKISNKVIGQ